MEHTKGKWEVEYSANTTEKSLHFGTWLVGIVCHSNEREANAYLMAAAPDLLEACKSVLETWDRHNVPIDAYLSRDRQKIEDAINKAEGGK